MKNERGEDVTLTNLEGIRTTLITLMHFYKVALMLPYQRVAL
jgi:hypothetical protein